MKTGVCIQCVIYFYPMKRLMNWGNVTKPRRFYNSACKRVLHLLAAGLTVVE